MKSWGASRLLALICLFITLLLGLPALHAAPGDLDPLDVTIGGYPILTTVVQPDGKILIGGDFSSVQGVPRNRIARFNEDGTLDTGFNPNANSTVESIVVQADGKILVGGYFTTLQPDPALPAVSRQRIARLHEDGSLDMGFYPSTDREVLSMVTQADGKIVIVGRFSQLTPNGGAAVSRTRMARLNPDGTLDSGFSLSMGGDIYNVAMQADGKILIGGDFFNLSFTNRAGNARLSTNGTLDTSFVSAGYAAVNSTAVQADGKILIGGAFGIARVNPNGTKDTGFNPAMNGTVYSMAVQADGKIITVGYFTTPRSRIARLHPDGSLDMAFDPKANNYVNSVAVQPDGKILVGGNFTSLQPNGAAVATPRAGFARLLNDPATESISVPIETQVAWLRGGSSPEFARVTFELSTDSGSTWSALGNGVRVGATPNWQLTGLSLPTNGQIRARGVTCDGNGSNGGLLESVESFGGLVALPEIAVYNGASTAAGDERADGFGSQFLGNTAQTFTIKNTGLADLSGLAVSLSGDAPEDYVLGALGATTLSPGATTTFSVTFSPTAIGVRNAVVNVASSDADEGTFKIKVSNLLPEIAVRGNTYNIQNGSATPSVPIGTDFGSVSVSGTGSTFTETFTIANTGAGNLALGAVVISGAHAADFSVTSQPVSPVAPGTSKGFAITFDPSETGLRSAIVSFSNNDADETPFSFSIQGTGFVSSDANLSALSISAGTLAPVFAAGTTSYTASVPYGDGSLTVRPTKAQANASISVRVNGGSYVTVASSANSSALPLEVGVNIVDVRVTAQDGTTLKTYSVTITRAAAVPGDVDALDADIVGSSVDVITVQPDGKTILGGSFSSVLGVPRSNIARLNADGTLDTGFNPMASAAVLSVAVQDDGKVLLGGSFSTLQPGGTGSPITRNRIARLNVDGTVDSGFDPNGDYDVTSIALQPDGKVLIGGSFYTLQPNGAATATSRNRIARLHADGTLDMGFDPNANNPVDSIVVQRDGKILLGGGFYTFQPNGGTIITTHRGIARLNADGTLDSDFNPRSDGYVSCIALQADNKVVLGGEFTTLQPNGAPSATTRNRIARLNADGTLDASFNPNVSGFFVRRVVIQADGKILLGGLFSAVRPNGASMETTRNHIARVNADGTLDAGFNPNAATFIHSVALQSDGKALFGGSFGTLRPNGAAGSTDRSRFARILNGPATQSIAVLAAGGGVQWLRGGTVPEVSQVAFELAMGGGSSFTPLGAASRIGVTANWQLAGLSLPSGGLLRARGRTLDGSGLVETVIAFGDFVTPLTTWRQDHFGSPTNSGNGADAFDFDKDGLANLIEYAFGLDPTVPDGGQLPQVQRMGGNLTVSFNQPAGVSGVTYGAEWSEDLETWVPLGDSGTSPQHAFSVPTAGNKTLFMRLSVSAP